MTLNQRWEGPGEIPEAVGGQMLHRGPLTAADDDAARAAARAGAGAAAGAAAVGGHSLLGAPGGPHRAPVGALKQTERPPHEAPTC